MAKITLPTIISGFASTTSFNTALDQIEVEFQDKVLYRNNTSGEANQMENDIDMNSNDLLNVGTINGFSASNLTNLTTYVSQAQTSATNAAASAASALVSANNADTSEASAAASAATAAIYSSMGLGGATAFDFGSITDLIVIFPTDWGTIV